VSAGRGGLISVRSVVDACCNIVPFAQAFAATVYSAYPRLIKAFIVSVVAYSHLGPLSVFDLRNAIQSGCLCRPQPPPALFTLASSVDPFMLWSLALASIGFTALSGLRRPVSAVIVFGLWAAFVLVAVLGTGTPPPR